MKHRWLAACIALIVFAGCSRTSPAPATLPASPVELEVRLEGRADLFIRRSREWINLTRFDRPRHILDHAASPDGRWVMVVHMDYAPAQAAIFETATLQNKFQQAMPENARCEWTAENRLKISSKNGDEVLIDPTALLADQ